MAASRQPLKDEEVLSCSVSGSGRSRSALSTELPEVRNPSSFSRNPTWQQKLFNLGSCFCPCEPCKRRPRLACGCCALVLVILIGMPLLLLVLAPSIAKHIAAGATVRVDAFNMAKLQEHSFEGHVKLLVRLPKPSFSPNCHMRTSTLRLSYDFGSGPGNLTGMRELGTLVSPSMALGAETTVEVTNNFTITDPHAMGQFMVRLMQSNQPVITKVTGMPEASLLGHSLGKIPMNVDVALWGMSPLKKINIDSFTLLGSDDQGVQIHTSVSLVNPTGASLSGLGVVKVGVSTQGYSLGSISVPDLVVTPGTVAVSAAGHLKPENTTLMTPIITDWLNHTVAIVDFQASGEESAPSWVKVGLSALNGKVGLPPYDGPPLIGGAELIKINVSMTEDASLRASATVSTQMHTPFKFPFEVLKMWGPVYLLDDEGQPVTFVDMPEVIPEWVPNPDQNGSGVLTASCPETSFTVVNQSRLGAQFASFLGSTSKLRARGTVYSTLNSSMGVITVGVPTDIETTISPALNGIQGMIIPLVDLQGGVPGSLTLKSLINVHNPSPVVYSMMAPCMPTIISYQGTDMGHVNTCNSLLLPNETSSVWATSEMASNPAAVAAVQAFTNGKDVRLDIRGDPASIPDGPAKDILLPIAKVIKTTSVMEGLKTPLMVEGQILMRHYDMFKSTVAVRLVVQNPWSAGFNITGVDAGVYVKPEGSQDYTLLLGSIKNLDLSKNPLVVRSRTEVANHPNQSMTPVPVHLEIDSCTHGNIKNCFEEVKSILSNGSVPAKVDCKMSLRIGSGYTMTVDYIQEGVPVLMKWDVGQRPLLTRQHINKDFLVDRKGNKSFTEPRGVMIV